VDAVRLNPQTATAAAAAGGGDETTTSVVVELERGTRRVESSAVPVSELARPTSSASTNTNWGPPLQQVVTLFRDSKGAGFRPKPFVLRVRLAKVLDSCGVWCLMVVVVLLGGGRAVGGVIG
jgi:hypothetical protein